MFKLASVFQFSFGGNVFSAFIRPQNTSQILDYELFVYWQNLYSFSYGNVTLLESDHDIVGYQVSDLIS